MLSKIQSTKAFSVIFHNSSTYDYHFIIKELAEEFQGQVKCFGENTEKQKYKIEFIDSLRFMSRSFSSLVDNLSDRLHSGIRTDCKLYLDYMLIKDDQ